MNNVVRGEGSEGRNRDEGEGNGREWSAEGMRIKLRVDVGYRAEGKDRRSQRGRVARKGKRMDGKSES